MSKISKKDEAIAKLWELGVLEWKLTPVQKIIKKGILEDVSKINVVLCSRRLGKSYLMCALALEQCISIPGSVVKFVFPKQKDAKRNIMPLMREILSDCPKKIKPRYMEAEKLLRFNNGSEIQFAGSDNGNIEGVRGGFSHLNIVDEAGFCNDLTYGIRSVLSPTTKTTGGRTILVSTPSRSPNHEFITNYVMPYKEENRVKVFTLYDNPNFTEEVVQEIIEEYPNGVNNPDFRREYLCEVIRDMDKSILPSFTEEVEKDIIVDSYEKPVFYDSYVSMDIGGRDLTAVLFGYYDYLNATLVIEDEIITDKDTNTSKLAEMIKNKEKELWVNKIDDTPLAPYLRVADNNNLIMLTDLQREHKITFIPTKKDNREAAINSLDVAVSGKKIRILSKCEHLIYHMKYAEWNLHRDKFKNLKDSPSGKIRGGHADALASLIYMYRNIVKSKNPYPPGYGDYNASDRFNSQFLPKEENNSIKTLVTNMFSKKKK